MKGMKKDQGSEVLKAHRDTLKEAILLDAKEKMIRSTHSDDDDIDIDNPDILEEALMDEWNKMASYNPDSSFDMSDYF